jgi:hypothetical protein
VHQTKWPLPTTWDNWLTGMRPSVQQRQCQRMLSRELAAILENDGPLAVWNRLPTDVQRVYFVS